ncbi:hypothetical protein [Phaeospirillum tilakii]|uniref:Lipoprotein n=1 Tax=Phaeospirillum tilakii TaxID=741673 RepID=A0ABW5CAP2_9PROT
MNNFRITALIACALPTLGGCAGGHFASEAKPVNLVPPAELRDAVPAAGYQNDLTALVGTIAVYNRQERSLQVLEPIANPYDPRTRPVVETVNQVLYSSLVDPSLQTDVPLITGALGEAGGQTLEVTVTDEAHAMVPGYSVSLINHLGSRYHPTSDNEQIVYVTEAWQRRFSAALLTGTEHSLWSANKGVDVYNGKTYLRTQGFKDGRFLTVSVVPFSRSGDGPATLATEPLPTSAVAKIKPMIDNPVAYTWHGPDQWYRGYGGGYGGGYGYGYGPGWGGPAR